MQGNEPTWLKRPNPFVTPTAKYNTVHKEAIRAIQALYKGVANDGQQIKAMTYILDVLCDRSGNQFYPDPRNTDFALGKKYVGDMIADAINVKLGQVKEPL